MRFHTHGPASRFSRRVATLVAGGVFATVALLLQLRYIDRMTLYYLEHREREECTEDGGLSAE